MQSIYIYIYIIERRFNLFFCLSHNSFAFVYRDEIPVTPRHVIIHGEERHGDPDKRPQVQREINKDVACYASATSTKRYVVACFPREMISRGLKWGVKSPRRRYLAVCVPRTGCNGAIITRRTIVCVDKKEGEEVETASS